MIAARRRKFLRKHLARGTFYISLHATTPAKSRRNLGLLLSFFCFLHPPPPQHIVVVQAGHVDLDRDALIAQEFQVFLGCRLGHAAKQINEENQYNNIKIKETREKQCAQTQPYKGSRQPYVRVVFTWMGLCVDKQHQLESR